MVNLNSVLKEMEGYINEVAAAKALGMDVELPPLLPPQHPGAEALWIQAAMRGFEPLLAVCKYIDLHQDDFMDVPGPKKPIYTYNGLFWHSHPAARPSPFKGDATELGWFIAYMFRNMSYRVYTGALQDVRMIWLGYPDGLAVVPNTKGELSLCSAPTIFFFDPVVLTTSPPKLQLVVESLANREAPYEGLDVLLEVIKDKKAAEDLKVSQQKMEELWKRWKVAGLI